jgi:hypothetical protein
MRATSENVGMAIQFVASCLIGGLFFWMAPELPPKARMALALITGFGGAYLLTLLYVWARHGFSAAKSMSLEP